MRTFRKILQYILAIILALAMFLLILLNIISSTILDESYLLSKLNETDYYAKIYEYAISNISNYLPQSGLDDDVLDGIITEAKIKEDTRTILDNIFNGTNNEIETDEIEEKLNENITNFLGEEIASAKKTSIDELIDTICDQYKKALTHTSFEKTINSYYKLIVKYINTINKVLIATIIISVLFIVFLQLRRIYKVLSRIGFALVIDGMIFIITKIYICNNVKVNNITIFNDAFSEVLRNIVNDILKNFTIYGLILLFIGITLILIYSIRKGISRTRRENAKYTNEDLN